MSYGLKLGLSLISAAVIVSCGEIGLFGGNRAKGVEDSEDQSTNTETNSEQSSGDSDTPSPETADDHLILNDTGLSKPRSSGDPVASAFVNNKNSQDLSFLFVQLSNPSGKTLKPSHHADLYLVVDVSENMEPSLENLNNNLGTLLGFLQTQGFALTTKIMKFSQFCMAQDFIVVAKQPSVTDYRDYLKTQIKATSPRNTNQYWKCMNERHGIMLPEPGFEAIQAALTDIQTSYADLKPNQRKKRHPLVIMITDHPSGFMSNSDFTSFLTTKTPQEEYRKLAVKMADELSVFPYRSQLRFYASLKDTITIKKPQILYQGKYLRQQYKTVLEENQSSLKDGQVEIKFPLADQSFLELMGLITASAAQDAPRACLLMTAKVESADSTKTLTTDQIRAGSLEMGWVKFKDALSGVSTPYTVSETRCCISVSTTATLTDLSRDTSKCSPLIETTRTVVAPEQQDSSLNP